MSLKWKDNEDVEHIKTVIKGKPPRAFVEKVEKWCPKNNSETSGYKKNLIKRQGMKEVKIILDILNLHPNEWFTIKQLINWQNANYITDGSLQRKVLGILVCNGIIKKDKIEYTNKKGDIKFRCEYKLVPESEQVLCPHLNIKKQKCEFEWRRAEETRYFTDEKEEK